MNVICHHAFIHHYRNICVFHETWLETRMSYFIDARAVFDRVFRGFILVIPIISVIFYRINPVLGIGFFSSQYLAELLQSTVQSGITTSNRKTFYSFPVYWTFILLEKIGLASTRRHRHHRHHCRRWTKLKFGWIFTFHLARSRSHDSGRMPFQVCSGQTRMTEYVTVLERCISRVLPDHPAIYLIIYSNTSMNR